MLKSTGDWLEKISAGSMLVGLFQGRNEAIAVGLVVFGVMLYIRWRLKK